MEAKQGSQNRWQHKDLLGIEPLEAAEIHMILEAAKSFAEISRRPIKKVPILRGRTIINLFYEPSTRTRSSFEIAEKRLSADTLNFSSSGSAMSKGETLLDTARNLEAMSPDMIVVRHRSPGTAKFLADRLRPAVINAGDGAHEHPTQALLDAFTILQKKGRIKNLRITIVGDILHSRVVRSNLFLLNKLGAEVTLVGPPTMMPREVGRLGVRVSWNLDEALEGCDVIMILRIQKERQSAAGFPSHREYFRLFGLTEERVRRAREDVIIMHPGPMNRGVEIATEVADGPFSVILEQVTNGIAVRMAILYLLAGGSASEITT